MKSTPMFWGKHPIAGVRPLAHSNGMHFINRYALGPSQQALLEAMICLAQPLLTEQSAVHLKPVVDNDDDLDYLTAD